MLHAFCYGQCNDPSAKHGLLLHGNNIGRSNKMDQSLAVQCPSVEHRKDGSFSDVTLSIFNLLKYFNISIQYLIRLNQNFKKKD